MYLKHRFANTMALLLLAATIQMACPVAARDLMKPFDFNEFQQQPQVVAKDYVNSASPKTGTFSRKESIDGVHRIGIVGFQVVFSEDTSEQTNGSTFKGLTQGNFNDNRWELEVQNLSPELRQKITETVYQQFCQELVNAGFEIEPQEHIFSNPNFSAYKTSFTAGDKDVMSATQRRTAFGKNTVWSAVPQGFPVEKVDTTADIFAGSRPGFMGGLSQVGAGFSAVGHLRAQGKALQDFSGFTPVAATYFVDLKKLKAIGGLLPGNPFGSSEKDSSFGLSVSPGSYIRFFTRAEAYGKDKTAANHQLNFFLKAPVQSIDNVGDIKFDKENIGTQAFTVAANLAFHSMGMGGIQHARKVRKYELVVQPEAYGTQAEKLLNAANRMLILAAVDQVKRTAPSAATPTDKTQ